MKDVLSDSSGLGFQLGHWHVQTINKTAVSKQNLLFYYKLVRASLIFEVSEDDIDKVLNDQ